MKGPEPGVKGLGCRLRRAVLGLWLGGAALLYPACDEPAPSAERQAVELAKKAPPPPRASTLPAGAVEIKLAWTRVGRTHQSFFGVSTFVDALSVGLTGLVRSPATLQIRYDEATAKGQIHLSAPAGALLVAPKRLGARVDLQPLSPVLEALAAYRAEVSGRYDLRILNFHTGIEAEGGGHRCVVGVPEVGAGDGRVVSPCVEFDGVVLCGEPSAEGVTFPVERAAELAACFGA